jgi:hypothetical protein
MQSQARKARRHPPKPKPMHSNSAEKLIARMEDDKPYSFSSGPMKGKWLTGKQWKEIADNARKKLDAPTSDAPTG